MSFRLIESGWSRVLQAALRSDHSSLRIICPFVKRRAVEQLLTNVTPASIQVITRFNLDDFAAGVSDTSALRLLLDYGAKVRGVRNLHSKLYLFGDTRAVVTSANLTMAALEQNHEFGFITTERLIINKCRTYFNSLWRRGGTNLSADTIDRWDEQIANYLAGGGNPLVLPVLPDEGVDAGLEAPLVEVPAAVVDPPQAFVKFFGWSENRVARDQPILDLLESTGGHWACTYPKGKRPRQVRDGALMFLARLTNDRDIVVFGRAIGMRHIEGRDDASEADIARRPWKDRWPHYIRVNNAEFVAGVLANGVSLNDLMDALGPLAFAATRERFENNPRAKIKLRGAYARKPAVRLTPHATAWLNERLQDAFNRYGKVPPADMARLDWPTIEPADVNVE